MGPGQQLAGSTPWFPCFTGRRQQQQLQSLSIAGAGGTGGHGSGEGGGGPCFPTPPSEQQGQLPPPGHPAELVQRGVCSRSTAAAATVVWTWSSGVYVCVCVFGGGCVPGCVQPAIAGSAGCASRQQLLGTSPMCVVWRGLLRPVSRDGLLRPWRCSWPPCALVHGRPSVCCGAAGMGEWLVTRFPSMLHCWHGVSVPWRGQRAVPVPGQLGWRCSSTPAAFQ